jgi:hypothetical protein
MRFPDGKLLTLRFDLDMGTRLWYGDAAGVGFAGVIDSTCAARSGIHLSEIVLPPPARWACWDVALDLLGVIAHQILWDPTESASLRLHVAQFAPLTPIDAKCKVSLS